MDEDGRFVHGDYAVRTGDKPMEYYSDRDDLPEEHRIFAYPEAEESIKKALESYRQTMGEAAPRRP